MLRRRSFWLALAAVLYLGAAALSHAPSSRQAWLALLAGPLLLVLGQLGVAPPRRGADRIASEARSAAFLSLGGVAVLVTAMLAPPTPGMQFAAIVGVALASAPAPLALARVRSLGGIAEQPALRGYDAVIFCALPWLVAAGLGLLAVADPGRVRQLGPDALPYTVVAAALASAGMTIVTALRVFARHRFELGVAERVAAALWLEVLAMALAVLASLTAVAPAELVVPLSAALGGAAVCWASVSSRPAQVSRAMRLGVSLALLAAPIVSVGVVVAYKLPTHAGVVVFWVALACSLTGVLAQRLARLLAPERGHWLAVLQQAVLAAKQPDPREAVAAALRSVHDGFGHKVAPAALLRLASRDRLTVDRAGYLHADADEVPPRLLEMARIEPEQVISTETLRHVQIRRPDVRPLVDWLDARDVGATALVIDEDVEVGVLLWPAVGRVSPLSYEEVVELRRLAQHLGSASGADAQLARSRNREMEAQQTTQRATEQMAALRSQLARIADQRRASCRRIAASVLAASYSPAAQLALTAVEDLAHRGPCALRVPAGVDVQAWAAALHLASPRAGEPLVWVACRDSAEQQLDGWRDPERSPLSLAAGGTLVLLDAHALPAEVQRYIAAAGGDCCVVATLPADSKTPQQWLDPHLADHLAEREQRLPTLAERAEDLRALALQLLARIGARLQGRSFGLSLRAQALLNEHSWPANEIELEAALWRAALATRGQLVDAEALAAAISADPLARSGPKWVSR